MDNGNKAPLTVDIGMRLVLQPESYAQVGALMDRVADLMRTALPDERAAFDFTNFQTHPCKAMALMERVEEQIYLERNRPVDSAPF